MERGEPPQDPDGESQRRLLNEASAAEVVRAATLADAVSADDQSRRSVASAVSEVADTVGIPAHYLDRAAALLKEAKDHRMRRRRKLQLAVSALACLAVTAVAVARIVQPDMVDEAARKALTSAWKPSQLEPGSARVAYDYNINLVPIATHTPLVLRAQGIDAYPTELEFLNDTGHPIKVFESDIAGFTRFRFSLAFHDRNTVNSRFGVPWLLTDADGRSIGVAFPHGGHMLVDVQDDSMNRIFDPTIPSRQRPGFLYPEASQASAVAAPASATETAIDFLNLRGEWVDVYREDADGSRQMVVKLAPGSYSSSTALINQRWLAVGEQTGRVIVYRAAAIPSTAVIRE